MTTNISNTLPIGSLILTYDRNTTQFTAVPQSALVDNVQAAIEAETIPAYEQDYTVAATGFTVQVASIAVGSPNRDVLLVITPLAGTTGTVQLPTAPDNNQIVQINMTSSTNMTLAFDGNGATVFTGLSSPLNFFTGTMQYFASINQWRLINVVKP